MLVRAVMTRCWRLKSNKTNKGISRSYGSICIAGTATTDTATSAAAGSSKSSCNDGGSRSGSLAVSSWNDTSLRCCHRVAIYVAILKEADIQDRCISGYGQYGNGRRNCWK